MSSRISAAGSKIGGNSDRSCCGSAPSHYFDPSRAKRAGAAHPGHEEGGLGRSQARTDSQHVDVRTRRRGVASDFLGSNGVSDHECAVAEIADGPVGLKAGCVRCLELKETDISLPRSCRIADRVMAMPWRDPTDGPQRTAAMRAAGGPGGVVIAIFSLFARFGRVLINVTHSPKRFLRLLYPEKFPAVSTQCSRVCALSSWRAPCAG